MIMRPGGFTLIEVLLVAVVLAVAAVGSQMLAPRMATQSVQAAAESRKLMAALRMARQTAISTQQPVRLRMIGSNPTLTGYVIEAQSGGVFVPLTPIESLPLLVDRSANASSVTFAPTGAADVGWTMTLGTGRQNHRLSVATATGMVRYAKR